MFTWICPECGSEVPPHLSECPDCVERKKGKPAQPAAPASAPAPAEPVRTAPPRQAPPESKSNLPGWLVTLIVAGVLIGVGAFFFYVVPSRRAASSTAAQATFEKPAVSTAHPMAKYVEVTGFRISEDAKQKARIQFVVINHSGAEIADLGGTVTLKAVTAKAEDPPLASFAFKVKSLEPYQAKDLAADVQMKLRAYELPDWQFLRADTTITSP